MSFRPRSFKRTLTMLVALAVIFAVRNYLLPEEKAEAPHTASDQGSLTVAQAEARRLSGVMITLRGSVEKTLADDNEGSRHQRFIVNAGSGLTVLVAHNIDLAQRVPLSRGDQVTLRGQYEWNDRGGVLHWTHHDPAGRHEGGWIEHDGDKYE